MLANGIKLGYKKKSEHTYTDLPGLQEVPEIGTEPELVENTTLADTVKMYEQGIGDAGELEYKFKFENSKATSTYRVLRKLEEAKAPVEFEHQFPDGTKFQYSAIPSVKVGGGGVNAPIQFSVKMALQSGFVIVDPS